VGFLIDVFAGPSGMLQLAHQLVGAQAMLLVVVCSLVAVGFCKCGHYISPIPFLVFYNSGALRSLVPVAPWLSVHLLVVTKCCLKAAILEEESCFLFLPVVRFM